MNKHKEIALEKEKSISETCKIELEQSHAKYKIEIDKLKAKYFDDIESHTNDYEMKLTDLNLK